jgi:hypothetical protein
MGFEEVLPISAKVGEGLEKFKEFFLLFMKNKAETLNQNNITKK